MPSGEPVWKVWQGRGKRSQRKLTPEQISWPLTRNPEAEPPDQRFPRLRRALTDPKPEPDILHDAKPFSSFPNPPPAAYVVTRSLAVSTSANVSSPCSSALTPTAPPAVTAFSGAYPTPPPSTRFPPADVRDAPPLTEYVPLSPPAPVSSSPKLKCTLVRSNARRDTNGRRRSGGGKSMAAASLPSPRLSGARGRQADAAREMQKAIEHHADRSGLAAPAYDFLELIGKGAFGRVYKGKHRESGELVAVKICDIDKADYGESSPAHRDETIKQLVKETSILRQLRDSSAQNVNRFFESFAFHSQLWMVTEYVAGGSVRTLMRATPGGTPQKPMPLEEHFIIPIAREVALGLQYVHNAGILHRDVKCANVMIGENGSVQLIDFGVSGLLETSFDKRSTIIGTPNWMPPEMIKDQVSAGYGTEVDCWAFGCTIYEMATGLPPDAGRNYEFLANRRQAPRLDGSQYSSGLRDFVSFILKERPYERPSVAEILQHRYVLDTRERFPSNSLSTLVKRFLDWQDRGGNRTSLWAAGGAEGLDADPSSNMMNDDWVFSTTVEFENVCAYEKRLSMLDPRRNANDAQNGASGDSTAAKGRGRRFIMHQKAIKAEQIRRGEEGLDRLFNLDTPEYTYGEDYSVPHSEEPDRPLQSDLALRSWEPNRASNRITMIDLDAADAGFATTPNLDLASASTLRASRINRIMKELESDDGDDGHDDNHNYKYEPNRASRRATKDWKFPLADPPAVDTARRATRDWKFPTNESSSTTNNSNSQEAKNRRTMDWTFATAELSETESQTDYRTSRLVQQHRGTKELRLPAMAAQSSENRRIPSSGLSASIEATHPNLPGGEVSVRGGLAPSPSFRDAWKPPLRHAVTQPIAQSDYFQLLQSAQGPPERSSMIDLDFADVGLDPLPSTAHSMVDSFTGSTDADVTTGNPFDLEEQAQLSQNNNCAFYHRQSQSEPQKRISGLASVDSDDDTAQGYVSDHGPLVEGREEQHRVSLGSKRSSAGRRGSNNSSLPHRLIHPKRIARGNDIKKPADNASLRFSSKLRHEDGLNDETIKSRHRMSQAGAPLNPESPRTWRYLDSLLSSTPPSTNGSISSSNCAISDAALSYSDHATQFTTPRASVATHSPEFDASPARTHLSLRTDHPISPDPAILSNTANQRLMVDEGSRLARDHVHYLKALCRTLKACGSQAQAERANRRARDNNANRSVPVSHSAGASISFSADTSDVEGVGEAVQRVLRRAESSLG